MTSFSLLGQVRRIVVALLVALPAFEGAIRLDEWMRFGVPFTSGATSINDLQVVDSTGLHLRPSAAFRNFRINNLGFRGPDVTLRDAQRRPTVIVTGSSETFGLYESAGKEWPRQLEDTLAERCPSARPLVLNAANAGMSLPNVIEDTRRRLLILRPKAIIYYPQPTQYLYESAPMRATPSMTAGSEISGWRLRAPMRLRSDIKAKLPAGLLDLLRRKDLERTREAGVTPFDTLPVDRLVQFESRLREFVGTVRAAGVPLILVLPEHRFSDTTSANERRWLRAWERLVPKASGAMMLAFSRETASRIKVVARDSAVRLVTPLFGMGAARSSEFADPVHFTDAGASIVATAVAASVMTEDACRVTAFAKTALPLISRPR